MKLKPFQIYLAALILVELILSAYVAYTSATGADFCLSGSSCTAVQNSPYGQFLGIKVSIWGALAFLVLLATYLWSRGHYPRYRWYFSATLIGTLVSLVFIGIQLFILKQVCSSCMVVDTLMLLVAALSTYEFFQLKRYY